MILLANELATFDAMRNAMFQAVAPRGLNDDIVYSYIAANPTMLYRMVALCTVRVKDNQVITIPIVDNAGFQVGNIIVTDESCGAQCKTECVGAHVYVSNGLSAYAR